MINKKFEILHTAFLYCTRLRSNIKFLIGFLTLQKCLLHFKDQYTDNSSFTALRSNITRNLVLNWNTAKNAYGILNDQYTDNF